MVDLKAANHTNRELELMLERRKPLAVFYAETDHLPDEALIPIDHFRPFVEDGRFVKEEAVLSGPYNANLARSTQIKYVLYATKGQEWRIPAFLLVKSTARKTGHNESLERMECALLGYTEEETDAWCKHCFHRAAT